jgi:hypothetical protein
MRLLKLSASAWGRLLNKPSNIIRYFLLKLKSETVRIGIIMFYIYIVIVMQTSFNNTVFKKSMYDKVCSGSKVKAL